MEQRAEETRIHHKLATKTDTQILETAYDSPTFIAPGLLPIGLTILAGKPKSGKSLMVTDLSNSLANGSRFLGAYDLPENEVLYFALEDTELRIQNRLKILANDPNGTGKIHCATQCGRLDHGLLDDLEDWLARNPAVKLVIVDTFNKVRRLKSRGTTPYEKDYNEINILKQFADDHKIAIMVVHHLRKSDAKDITDTIAGSTGITAAADAIMILQKERGSNHAILSVTGRDMPDFEMGIALNPESLCWEIASATEELTREREEILEILKNENRPMRLGEIATAVGKKNNNVHKLLAGLITAGAVGKTGYGIYELKKEPAENNENETICGESGECSSIAA